MDPVNKLDAPNRPYHVKPYDHNWPAQFEQQKTKLEGILGGEIIRVEHMGSTAVPGLAAKPQIDVLVEVKDLSVIPHYFDLMRANGYESRGDYSLIGEEYFTLDNKDGTRIASVHVLPADHPEIAFQINFRDFLRSHPNEVEDYGQLKLALKQKFPNDRQSYGKGKERYIADLRARVTAWANEK